MRDRTTARRPSAARGNDDDACSGYEVVNLEVGRREPKARTLFPLGLECILVVALALLVLEDLCVSFPFFSHVPDEENTGRNLVPRRLVPFDPALGRVKDVIGRAVLAGALRPTVGATFLVSPARGR